MSVLEALRLVAEDMTRRPEVASLPPQASSASCGLLLVEGEHVVASTPTAVELVGCPVAGRSLVEVLGVASEALSERALTCHVPHRRLPLEVRAVAVGARKLVGFDLAAGFELDLFNANRDGVLLVDESTALVLEANDAAASFFGCAASRLRGKALAGLFRSDGPHPLVARLAGGLLSPNDFPVLKALRADGTERAAEVANARVELAGRSVWHLSLRDVTERSRAEAERARALHVMHQSQKLEALGELAAGVAHDMKNVLSVVTSFAQALARDLPAGDSQQDASQILVAATRGGDLVRQLLDFARREPSTRETVDAFVLVREAAQLCQRMLPETVRFETSVPSNEVAYVLGDRSQFVHVLLNLLVNARDAMPNGGLLTLSAQVDERRVLVRVVDTGEGMSPDVKSRALEPFFTTKARGRGTGLGLAMVHASVRAHGGDVRLESELGVGTAVTLWLPLEFGGALSRETPQPKTAQPLRRGRALVIDDDENTCKVMRVLLEGMGFEVTATTKPLEAAGLVRAGSRPLVTVCDLVMPGLDGAETMRRIKAVDPLVPVIIASGFIDGEERARVLREGASDVLSKPFSADEFERAVERVVARESEFVST